MVNTNMTFVFKHPKFYRIPRDKTDQAISLRTRDGEYERASDPGHKQQASSYKLPGPRLETGASCPAPSQGGKCLDCRQCWDPNIKTVSYGKH